MKRTLVIASFLFLRVVSSYAQSTPPLFRCKDQTRVINLSLNDTGERVEGPVCAQITINALRYSYDFGKTVTYSSGPNLTSIFPSSFSPGGAVAGAETSLEARFLAYESSIDQISKLLLLVQSKNRTASSNVDRYLNNLRALINQSDDVLSTSGPAAVLALVNSPDAKKQMDDALNERNNWNTTDELGDQLRALRAKLNELPATFPNNTGAVTGDPCSAANITQLGWNDWNSKCRESRFKLAQSNLAGLLTDASQLTSDSDKAAQFARKLGIIQFWKNTIAGLSEASFTRQTEVRCSVLFNKNQQTTLKLIVADRTSVFDGQTPQPQTKDTLLIVECGSPFSISAGAAFNIIENKEFGIVKSKPASGGTTSVNTFGTTASSRVNPYPIAIAHARLRDWNQHRYGLHFSFGVGANIKGQNSGGSNPEFLTGLSISFLRTIFVTGGLDIGKHSQLSGGFKVGDIVPTDITTPPISSSYKPGFGFAITFTKP